MDTKSAQALVDSLPPEQKARFSTFPPRRPLVEQLSSEEYTALCERLSQGTDG